ncbi:polysaccharide deacetylase family protein [Ammonifex thiophilus]|uniref:Polysaccharide deacetylase n=1 Tax=Ammonifex thiophilus TaxID=444093 RepID=A0A3D8P553_9THEO|nr:polysaccharide deacetylase family protein [Ammonifex thiophilus]RDV82523.1 polysaccharide deacetylase [Ammonifex thiophilus]
MAFFFFCPSRHRVRLFLWLLLLGLPLILGRWLALDDSVLETSAAGPVYHGPSSRREIALTFNVYWGEEHLPRIMQILEERRVKATFFLGGEWVERHPELAREIARRFEVGNHGYAHRHPDRLSVEENLREIRRAAEVIKRVTGKETRLFAPPYGERGASVLEAASRAGHRVILWSIDPVDWKNPPAAVISQIVIGKAHNGAIVLLHPTAPTAEALPHIIEELRARGYRFVTVEELLEHGAEAEK